MGLGDLMKNALKSALRLGEVNGSDFPVGTYINIGTDESEKYMIFTYPNKEEEKITHDMIKCATVLAMGVIDIQSDGRGTTLIHGTKYLCVLKDGRQAVLTVGLGKNLYEIEHILF